MRGGNPPPPPPHHHHHHHQCHCHVHCCTAATGLQRGVLLCQGGLRLPPPFLSHLTPLCASKAAFVWGLPPPQHLQTHHMLPSLIPLQQPRSADAVVGRGERGPRPEEDGGGAAVEFRSWLRLKTRRRSVEPLGEPGDFWGLPRRRAPSPSRPYLFTAINDIFSAALRARGGGGGGRGGVGGGEKG